jgi:hypothetical protein
MGMKDRRSGDSDIMKESVPCFVKGEQWYKTVWKRKNREKNLYHKKVKLRPVRGSHFL